MSEKKFQTKQKNRKSFSSHIKKGEKSAVPYKCQLNNNKFRIHILKNNFLKADEFFQTLK